MKRRLGVVLLILGIGVAVLPGFTPRARAGIVEPLQITKTTTEGNQAHPGGRVYYEITVHNPNADSRLSLDCITDTLPAGFSYVPESTSGSPDSPGEPDSQDCGSFGWFYDGEYIGAGQSITLDFAADVSENEPAGVYCNEASAFWDQLSANTGPTAPVVVTALQAEAVQEPTCAQPTPPAIVRTATPTSTATARATATATAAPPTKTATPQSTVLAAQATPKPQQPAALPSTGSGSGNGRGASSWVLALAGTLIVAGAGLTLAGRKRA